MSTKAYGTRCSGAIERKAVIDTSGFFVSAARLRNLVESGDALSTPDLVIFEFLKSVRKEASMSRGAGNTKRAGVMAALERRLPELLRGLEVEVWGTDFGIDDVDQVYSLTEDGHEPGDAMIWVKMQRAGLDTIATADTSDWKALGAKVISLA